MMLYHRQHCNDCFPDRAGYTVSFSGLLFFRKSIFRDVASSIDAATEIKSVLYAVGLLFTGYDDYGMEHERNALSISTVSVRLHKSLPTVTVTARY